MIGYQNGYTQKSYSVNGSCTTTTATIKEPCKHLNGFYDTVYFCFDIFRKTVFVCTDCERILSEDKKTILAG